MSTGMSMRERWKQGPPTEEEVLALPVRVDLVDAARALGIHEEEAYRQAARGWLDAGQGRRLLVAKNGRKYMLNRRDLLEALSIQAPTAAAARLIREVDEAVAR